MGFYQTTISVSVSATNDKEASDKIDKILDKIREEKGAKPFVEKIKKATSNKFVALDSQLIKKLNIK